MIVVGDAVIACQYQFRQMTTDIDTLPSQQIKSAANRVADKYNLPNGWINTDFMHTKSYSPAIRQYSNYYKTFSGVLETRVLGDEYLVAMKMMSFRAYKRDMSDMIGVVNEMRQNGKQTDFSVFEKACVNLYGSMDNIPEKAIQFLQAIIQEPELGKLYQNDIQSEDEAKEILRDAQEKLPRGVVEKYTDSIIEEGRHTISENHLLSKLRNITNVGNAVQKENTIILTPQMEKGVEIRVDLQTCEAWLQKGDREISVLDAWLECPKSFEILQKVNQTLSENDTMIDREKEDIEH